MADEKAEKADKAVPMKAAAASPQTALQSAPKRFATVVEDAPAPKRPLLSEKTRAEHEAGRRVLAAYSPAPLESE